MSRREKTITIKQGRDKGKTFLIREMSAYDCEEWGRELISTVYRCALQSENGLMMMLSDSIREAFTEPVVPEIKPPSGMSKEHPAIKRAQAEAEQQAVEAAETQREATPAQLVSVLGLRIFMQLPFEEQERVLAPLMACISMGKSGEEQPFDRDSIEDSSTIVTLRAEAFRLHTDFFMPAVPSIYRRLRTVGAAMSHETSPTL
ncbi:hypothetical protein [Entomobacter blattae]|uniref:Uncharacterized protein n=1 Tax=Entomobacter blattae TaxID=2762277 RepID=A0A7H1NU44_9PROT|nr:hypothetical protein [Entomobacter blattae]QNT79304.1 hypothetical protein JGUZn3_21010 [Entomobacter blattae]